MENEKIEFHVNEAERHLSYMNEYNPELSQAFMLRGIGHAVLAIFGLLKGIEEKDEKESNK